MRTLNRIRENGVVVNNIFSFSRFSLNIYIFYVFDQIVRSIGMYVLEKLIDRDIIDTI